MDAIRNLFSRSRATTPPAPDAKAPADAPQVVAAAAARGVSLPELGTRLQGKLPSELRDMVVDAAVDARVLAAREGRIATLLRDGKHIAGVRVLAVDHAAVWVVPRTGHEMGLAWVHHRVEAHDLPQAQGQPVYRLPDDDPAWSLR